MEIYNKYSNCLKIKNELLNSMRENHIRLTSTNAIYYSIGFVSEEFNKLHTPSHINWSVYEDSTATYGFSVSIEPVRK